MTERARTCIHVCMYNNMYKEDVHNTYSLFLTCEFEVHTIGGLIAVQVCAVLGKFLPDHTQPETKIIGDAFPEHFINILLYIQCCNAALISTTCMCLS